MFKQAGISLVETMIGLSIAAGISLVLMRQQETSNQMQAKTSADQNINSAVNIIQTSLANRAICTKTIENKGVGDSLTRIVDAINVDPNTPDIFIVGSTALETEVTKLNNYVDELKTFFSAFQQSVYISDSNGNEFNFSNLI